MTFSSHTNNMFSDVPRWIESDRVVFMSFARWKLATELVTGLSNFCFCMSLPQNSRTMERRCMCLKTKEDVVKDRKTEKGQTAWDWTSYGSYVRVIYIMNGWKIRIVVLTSFYSSHKILVPRAFKRLIGCLRHTKNNCSGRLGSVQYVRIFLWPMKNNNMSTMIKIDF